jgi:hypothetical protein
MNLPKLVSLMGFMGLIPFFAGPLWLTWMPGSAPSWLDHLWLTYIAMIASFMAGTFWGFALPASQGPDGLIGLGISMVLMVLAWVSTALPFEAALGGLALVFLLLLLADFWRERVLDTIGGYFLLRTTLTVGVLLAIGWRLWLVPAAA